MLKTFAALENLIPGSRIVDISFTVFHPTQDDIDLDMLDKELAHAIDNAEPIDMIGYLS